MGAIWLVSACAGPAGPAGAPCTVADNGNGTSKITCPDGTTATVVNGTAGTNGTNGTPGATGPAGDAGSSCTAVQVDGGIQVACTNGTTAFVPAGTTGANGTPGLGLSTGLVMKVTSVNTAGPISVRFTVKDDRGNPIDLAGNYSVNVPFAPRFSLSQIVQDADGGMLPYAVQSVTGNLTAATVDAGAPDPTTVKLSPSAFSPTYPIPAAGIPATDPQVKGSLVENGVGAGDYTYTFPTGGNSQLKNSANKFVTTVTSPIPAVNANSTYTIWIQAQREWNLVDTNDPQSFRAQDLEYNFIPSGVGTPLRREIASTAGCSKCHNKFIPEGTVNSQFHGGGRVEAAYCNVCHNPARTSNPLANSASFVHRIHAAKKLVANPDGGASSADVFDGTEAETYPQDIRNCDACHAGAAQGSQAITKPSIIACGSCHDGVKFDGTGGIACTNPPAKDANGRFIACNHVAGQKVDGQCALCHDPAEVTAMHVAILPPDPTALKIGVPGGNDRTNAGFISAAGDIPTGATRTQYVIKSVGKDATGHLQMTFKLQQAIGTALMADVNFGTYTPVTNTELIPGFVGGPSAYFAFSVLQDGIAVPADFNASASCYIKNAWNGSAVGATASACTMIADPGGNGFYQVTMTNVVPPAGAGILTGGVGYTYQISVARPLTQINLANFPYDAVTGIGGLIVAAPDVWMTAAGFTPRRPIVENARCNNCHVQLGVGPSFHVGQRNDAPTCAFCHNTNQNNGGWSGNSKDFIHAIHGARKRTVPFTWHAASATQNYGEVGFPSNLNDCQACHLPATNDYSLPATIAALPNMLSSTQATGTYPGSTAAYALSPYVNPTGAYGVNFSYNAATGATVAAAPTTLVKSPITAACSACHDTAPATGHMQDMGGLFYDVNPARALVAATPPVEQCLICHGPGTIAPIAIMHKNN